MGRIAFLTVFLLNFTAVPAMAECGKPDPSDGVSSEAKGIINKRFVRKLDASNQIDLETAQQLLERIFDPHSGKQKELPPTLLDQYSRDARYFSALLKKEAAEAAKRADAVLAKLDEPCPVPRP